MTLHPEGLPPKPESKLYAYDTRTFSEMVLWPAVNSFYGSDFRAVAEAGEDASPKDKFIESPDRQKAIRLEATAYCYERGQEDEAIHNIIVNLGTRRDDLAEDLSDTDKRKGTVWEFTEYSFEPSDNRADVHRYFGFSKRNGAYTSKISRQTGEYIRDLGTHDADLQLQDCIDVYNVLLALGVPELEMNYDDWRNLSSREGNSQQPPHLM